MAPSVNGERGRSRSRSRSMSLSRSPSRSRSRSRSYSRSYSRSRSPYSRSPSPRSRDSRSISPPPRRRDSRSLSPRRRGATGDSEICVSRLSKNVNERHLKEIFGAYGEIRSVDLPIIRRIGTHRGTAHVFYIEPAAAKKAIEHMHKGQIDGSIVDVDYRAPSPPPRGPRGGAYGGRRSRSPPPRKSRSPPYRRRSPPRRPRSRSPPGYRPRSRTPPPRRRRSPSFSRSPSPPRFRGGRRPSPRY